MKGSAPSRKPSLSASFIMPVLDEEAHLRAAVESVFGQTGLAEFELILVVGMSKDRTDEVVSGIVEAYPQVIVLRNPVNAIPRAMNMGFAAARYRTVMRVDAHSVLEPDYARRACETMARIGAANVGGRMLASGSTPFEQAVAWCYNSRRGLGGAVYHTGGESGPAESAYLGVFDRAAVLAVGGYDETLQRGEDWELNFRLRSSDYLVWYDKELVVTYRPRSSFRALARQFYATGRWRGELVRRLGGGIPIRYFVPPTLVALLALSAALELAVGIWRLRPAPVYVGLGLVVPVVYLAWIVSSVVIAHELGRRSRLWLMIVLPVIHVCWGVGWLVTVLTRVRARGGLSGR